MSEYSAPTQFIDLAAQQKLIRPQLDAAIRKVLDHGHYIMGPEVVKLEVELAEFTGVSNVISCANGTDALTLVLMAWGIGPGDLVFVPSFTYVASAEAVAQIGAVPFFVDVCPSSFNIDAQSLKQAIIDSRLLDLTPRAVIAVDLFGQSSVTQELLDVVHESQLRLLVDAAQSFGAENQGKMTGTLGDATTTSFFPAKPLGCYGDGGAVFTNDKQLAEVVSSIRLHGKGVVKYDNVRVGLNSRLDTLQAAILIEKLRVFPLEVRRRNEIAQLYDSKIVSPKVKTPAVPSGYRSVWAQYTLVTEDRDGLIEHLSAIGIPSSVYYPKSLSQQIGYLDCPIVSNGVEVSERLSNQVLSIPMHPYLEDHECLKIADAINRF